MPGMISPADDTRGRQYRWLVSVEGVLLLATWGMSYVGMLNEPAFWLFVALFLWHVVGFPICLLWVMRPLVLSFAPLIQTPETREFRRMLSERPALDDDTYYRNFYEGSEIPKDVLVRLRRCVWHLDRLIDRVIPSDHVYLLDDEFDFSVVVWLAEKEFGIRFDKSEYEQLDGTFDNLIRLVQKKINSECRT